MSAERKIGLAAFYNSVYAARGFALAPHHYPLVSAIEDTRIENLLFLGPAGAGESNLLGSVLPAWEIGHDPSLTTLSVSAGERLPQGFMAATMQIIQHSEVFRKLFPDVKPDPSLGWSIQRGLFVKGHHPSDPDASYFSCGLASKALTGLHARLHIYDDIHDKENAATPEMRAQVVRTYYDTLMGRADPRGCRRVAAGRWWAKDDVYQEWINNGDWTVMQLPANRGSGNTRLWYDVSVPKGLACVFTETLEPEPDQDEHSPYIRYKVFYGALDATGKGFYWPGSPSKRKEYETVARRQPRIATINYNGDFEGADETVFRESDFRPYIPPEGLEDGILSPAVRRWVQHMGGDIEDAWDTALGQPQSESLTAAITGLLVPCQEWHLGEDPAIVGPCDFHYDVYLLDLMVRDIDFRELAMALRERHAKWLPRRVNVEEKQSGVGLLQIFKGSHIPVRGQKVVQGKLERAINPVMTAENGAPISGGAASVQGWGRMGRILYPAGAEWVEHGPDGQYETGWMAKICAYSGGSKGTDEFDALVHLVTRAIVRSKKIGRFGSAGPQAGKSDEDGLIQQALAEDPRYKTLEAINTASAIANMSQNPMQGMCIAPCNHYTILSNREWCALHDRQTSGLNGCSGWAEKERARG